MDEDGRCSDVGFTSEEAEALALDSDEIGLSLIADILVAEDACTEVALQSSVLR